MKARYAELKVTPDRKTSVPLRTIVRLRHPGVSHTVLRLKVVDSVSDERTMRPDTKLDLRAYSRFTQGRIPHVLLWQASKLGLAKNYRDRKMAALYHQAAQEATEALASLPALVSLDVDVSPSLKPSTLRLVTRLLSSGSVVSGIQTFRIRTSYQVLEALSIEFPTSFPSFDSVTTLHLVIHHVNLDQASYPPPTYFSNAFPKLQDLTLECQSSKGLSSMALAQDHAQFTAFIEAFVDIDPVPPLERLHVRAPLPPPVDAAGISDVLRKLNQLVAKHHDTLRDLDLGSWGGRPYSYVDEASKAMEQWYRHEDSLFRLKFSNLVCLGINLPPDVADHGSVTFGLMLNFLRANVRGGTALRELKIHPRSESDVPMLLSGEPCEVRTAMSYDDVKAVLEVFDPGDGNGVQTGQGGCQLKVLGLPVDILTVPLLDIIESKYPSIEEVSIHWKCLGALDEDEDEVEDENAFLAELSKRRFTRWTKFLYSFPRSWGNYYDWPIFVDSVRNSQRLGEPLSILGTAQAEWLVEQIFRD